MDGTFKLTVLSQPTGEFDVPLPLLMPAHFLSLSERQALTQFPSTVTDTDLVRYFTLSQRDLQQLVPFRSTHNRLGFALQLCTLRFLGFSPLQLDAVPLPVLHYLAQQLALDPSALNRYGRRSQTRRRHRQTVEQYLGFQACSQVTLAPLQAWLLNRALDHDKPSLLLELAIAKLYRDKIVRPGISTLERLVTQVRAQAMQTTFESIQPLLAPHHYPFLDQLLQVDQTLGMTRLSWLRRPATMNSPKAILKTLHKLNFLNQQGIADWNLAHLNPNRLKFLAQLGKRSSAQALQRNATPKRYSILVAFLYQIRTEVIDEAIDLFIRCLSDTYARARGDRQSAHLEAAVALNEKVRVLQELGTVVLDAAVADEQVRTAMFERVPRSLGTCGALLHKGGVADGRDMVSFNYHTKTCHESSIPHPQLV
jgi:TnpA family transposase